MPDCDCNTEGSIAAQCNSETGQCQCKPNVIGLKCDQCAEGYGISQMAAGRMDGVDFPNCLKQINIKFHVIDAYQNKGLQSVTITRASPYESAVTDSSGFAYFGIPFYAGESVTIEVSFDGYDHYSQEFVVTEDLEFMMIGLNPTVSK